MNFVQKIKNALFPKTVKLMGGINKDDYIYPSHSIEIAHFEKMMGETKIIIRNGCGKHFLIVSGNSLRLIEVAGEDMIYHYKNESGEIVKGL